MGFIPFVILERALTFYRYGSWFVTATSLHVQTFTSSSTSNVVNGVVQGENKSIPWQIIFEKIQIDKLFAPLLSPEKSIFLYDPLVPICLILAIVCWRYLSNPIKLFLGVGLINLIFHWALYSWITSWVLHGEWGARYHVTSIHLLLLPLIPLVIQGAIRKVNKDSLSKIFSWIARTTIVIAILIQLASVVLPPGLEAAQQKIGVGRSLRLVQRIQNIGLVATNDRYAHPQISKVIAESPGFAPNNRVVWDLFPFRFQDRIGKGSSLAFLAPILIILWLVLVVMAIASTVWVFVS